MKGDGVDVSFWGASEVPHGFDAEVGVAHAKLGYPVDVVIKRRGNAHRIHLSLAEVRSLMEQFAPLAKLDDVDGSKS